MQTTQYEVANWHDIYNILLELARTIKQNQILPEIIVGVSRGGWLPARILSDLLDIPQLTSIRIEFYSEINQPNREPIITQPVPLPLHNKRVLLVDDITDSGKSLQLAKIELGKTADKIYTLTLYHKPWSCLTPDFYFIETSKWVIFPWEYHESVKTLATRMINEGLDFAAIEQELIKIGFEASLVTNFMKEIFGFHGND
ncbi:MAG: phosphoribosyltransferase [Candidatus Bathyarchaeota archaeon]|jgi:hypoxanthine phosphoribosyltransferase|nr:phosphoribosyltransferase [Candidatus Bathyarchaeota archaeon]